MKLMRKLYLNSLSAILAFVGIFFGFSKKVLAQYAAPENYFLFNPEIDTTIIYQDNREELIFSDKGSQCNFDQYYNLKSAETENADTQILDNETITEDTLQTTSTLITRFSVFPNPNRGIFTVEFTLEEEQDVWVRIYQDDCKILIEERIEKHKGLFSKKYNITKYGFGGYFIIINAGNFTQRSTIIKE